MIIRYDYPLYTNTGIAANSTTYTLRNASGIFYYESSKYTSPTIYMEVTMKSATASSNDTYVVLAYSTSLDYVSTSSTWTNVAATETISSSATNAVYRSASLSATNGYRYTFKYRNELTAVSTVVIYDIRVVVLDDVGTGTPTNINSAYHMHIGFDSATNNITNASYTEINYSSRFAFDSSVWGGSVTCYLEAYLYSSTSNDCNLQIYNVTDSAAVSNSQVAGGGAPSQPQRYRSNSFSLTSGKTYSLQGNYGSGTGGRVVYAKVMIEQANPTSTRISVPLMGTRGGTSLSYSTTTYGAVRYRTADWTSSNATIYHNCVQSISASTGTAAIATINSSTPISNSTLTTTSTTRVINTGGSQLSLSNATDYQPIYTCGAGAYLSYVPCIQFNITFPLPGRNRGMILGI